MAQVFHRIVKAKQTIAEYSYLKISFKMPKVLILIDELNFKNPSRQKRV